MARLVTENALGLAVHQGQLGEVVKGQLAPVNARQGSRLQL